VLFVIPKYRYWLSGREGERWFQTPQPVIKAFRERKNARTYWRQGAKACPGICPRKIREEPKFEKKGPRFLDGQRKNKTTAKNRGSTTGVESKIGKGAHLVMGVPHPVSHQIVARLRWRGCFGTATVN